eukprot:3755709-Rhodomonas_salina.2
MQLSRALMHRSTRASGDVVPEAGRLHPRDPERRHRSAVGCCVGLEGAVRENEMMCCLHVACKLRRISHDLCHVAQPDGSTRRAAVGADGPSAVGAVRVREGRGREGDWGGSRDKERPASCSMQVGEGALVQAQR